MLILDSLLLRLPYPEDLKGKAVFLFELAHLKGEGRYSVRSLPFFIAYFLVTMAAGVTAFKLILTHSVGLSSSVDFLLFLTFTLLFMFMFALATRGNADSIEHLFVLLGVPAVVGFALLMIPGNIPDEPAHLQQAVDVFGRHSGAILVPSIFQESSFPSTYSDLYKVVTASGTWDNQITASRVLTSYFDHLYIIPFIVFRVGSFFDVNAMMTAVYARLANGLVFVASGYVMLKTVPCKKTALLVFLLNPMLVQQETSVSADVLVNISALLYICYFIRLNQEDSLSARKLLVLFALLLFMLASKFMYAPLALLPLLLLKRRFDQKHLVLIYGLTSIACFGFGVLFIHYYHGSLFPEAFELMRQPAECLKVLVKTFWVVGPFWFETYLGSQLGALNIYTWSPCYIIYFALQVTVLFFNDEEEAVSIFTALDKICILALVLINLILLVLTMRGWSVTVDQRSDVILGIQGRYLLPLGFTTLACIGGKHIPSLNGRIACNSVYVLAVIYIPVCLSAVSHFAI